MAAINVGAESFYAGSIHADAAALRAASQRAAADGADMIDLGARSTAPYRRVEVAPDEERARLVWAIEVVRSAVALPISADTTRARVAAAALRTGARIVNDVSGLCDDPSMADVAAGAEGVVLVAGPRPGVTSASLAEVHDALRESIGRARAAGIDAGAIVLDPGIGFFPAATGSSTAFNCAVLRDLAQLDGLGYPLLVGVSRKRFIGELTGRSDPADRLAGSLAATAIAVLHGAAVIRTHDVAATRDAIRVAEALCPGARLPAT
jgi:dihydropteroate synthase